MSLANRRHLLWACVLAFCAACRADAPDGFWVRCDEPGQDTAAPVCAEGLVCAFVETQPANVCTLSCATAAECPEETFCGGGVCQFRVETL